MELNRTVIIPTDDAALAAKLFKNLVYNEDCIVAVILGDSDEAKEAVAKADKRAEAVIAGFSRKVAWIRDREIVKREILDLMPDIDLDGTLAFSVSLENKIADCILSGDPVDFFRIEQLFMKAGMRQ